MVARSSLPINIDWSEFVNDDKYILVCVCISSNGLLLHCIKSTQSVDWQTYIYDILYGQHLYSSHHMIMPPRRCANVTRMSCKCYVTGLKHAIILLSFVEQESSRELSPISPKKGSHLEELFPCMSYLLYYYLIIFIILEYVYQHLFNLFAESSIIYRRYPCNHQISYVINLLSITLQGYYYTLRRRINY